MEETENQEQYQPTPNNPSPERPSYTSGVKPKKKSPIAILMVIALLLIGGGIYFLVKKGTVSQTASPTPDSLGYSATEEPTQEPTSTPETVDRDAIKIQILNGTGIPKEASYLQGKMRDLGYTQIEVANSDDTDFTATEVYFASNVPDAVISEIGEELESVYEDVKTKTGSTGNYDIKIITGLRKGATAKPAATKTPVPTATSTTRATSTSSPTPTASPTSTP